MSWALNKQRSSIGLALPTTRLGKMVHGSTNNWDNVLKYYEKPFTFWIIIIIIYILFLSTFSHAQNQTIALKKREKNSTRTESTF